MTDRMLSRVVVPVANEADTRNTCSSLQPYLDRIGEVVFVHVVEQTPGYMDYTSPTALEEEAEGYFELAREVLRDEVPISGTVRFGTDVVEELVDLALDEEATAILFRPRAKGRLTRLVTKDAERALLRETPVPLIVLPAPEGE